MLQEIFRYNILLYVIGAFCLLGVLCKGVVWISYRRLMKATESAGKSANGLTQKLRMKFENCYRLNLNVQNISAFVDKYLQHYKVLGLRVHTWNQLVRVFAVGIGLVTVGACLGLYFIGDQALLTALYAAAGIGSVMLLGLLECLLDVKDKQRMAATNLMDYLDNTLSNRLHHQYEDDPGKTVLPKEMGQALKQGKAQTAATNLKIRQKKAPRSDTIDEEAVIREILREFLT